MVNLSTKYMGLQLKNPLIIGSSGQTSTVERIKELEAKGAGAIVLKSFFEEQVSFESQQVLDQSDEYSLYPEAAEYIRNFTKSNSVADYLTLIKGAKQAVSIPVIASINCVNVDEWVNIAKDIEKAGADALEVNMFFMPTDVKVDALGYEKRYFDIIEKLKHTVKIPIALKISPYFSSLASMLQKLSWTGVDSLVLFNRFQAPDIDVDTFELYPSNFFSTRQENYATMRWIALISKDVKCDISATTGIHTAEDVIKQLLVGATTTQLCSTLYLNGTDRISEILNELTAWMEKHKYTSIADFRGKLGMKKDQDAMLFSRVQYMKNLFENK